jgi:hypothetical protein
MTANKTQVGGSHYSGDYQHWDFSVDVGMFGLDYAMTKYVARWKKKNGLQDLMKAHHYAVKMKELMMQERLTAFTRNAECSTRALKFCLANDLGQRESHIVMAAAQGLSFSSLDFILDHLNKLIEGVQNPKKED